MLDGNTIIGADFDPPQALQSLLLEPPGDPVQPDEGVHRRLFKIRAADSLGQRSSASILVNRMYATRGYTLPGSTDANNNVFTLLATEQEHTIGTLSIGFDSDDGLLVDDLFRAEVDSLRRQGRRVCEFTKLAVDHVVRSRKVLASLFHVAYIWAHRIHRFDDLVIEVNPRHVRFYERMLGFAQFGPQRLNRRVNAPAVLLRLDFGHAQSQVGHFGGQPELGDMERSLYPFFFSVPEEAGIVGRLLPTVRHELLMRPAPWQQLAARPHVG